MSAAFGRGAMTNPRYDLKNTKLAWVEGSNIAECHPMGLKNLMKAKKNGLKIMHVDVRFTRTSKIADYFIQIRPGTDIAFLGAIINYVIQNPQIRRTIFALAHKRSLFNQSRVRFRRRNFQRLQRENSQV